jgi:hypothetical protein
MASHDRSCNTEDTNHAPDEIVNYTTGQALHIGCFRSLPIVRNQSAAYFKLCDIIGSCTEFSFIIKQPDRNWAKKFVRSSSYNSHGTSRSQISQSHSQTGSR